MHPCCGSSYCSGSGNRGASLPDHARQEQGMQNDLDSTKSGAHADAGATRMADTAHSARLRLLAVADAESSPAGVTDHRSVFAGVGHVPTGDQASDRSGTVVVVADRSESMPTGSQTRSKEAVDLIQRAMSARDQLGVVSFGHKAIVERACRAGELQASPPRPRLPTWGTPLTPHWR